MKLWKQAGWFMEHLFSSFSFLKKNKTYLDQIFSSLLLNGQAPLMWILPGFLTCTIFNWISAGFGLFSWIVIVKVEWEFWEFNSVNHFKIIFRLNSNVNTFVQPENIYMVMKFICYKLNEKPTIIILKCELKWALMRKNAFVKCLTDSQLWYKIFQTW